MFYKHQKGIKIDPSNIDEIKILKKADDIQIFKRHQSQINKYLLAVEKL